MKAKSKDPLSGTGRSRRRFIRTTAAASLAVSLTPYVRAEDKAGAKNRIVGSGAYQYEVIHDWGELPARITYGNTHGVAQDSQGRVYVKHTVGTGSVSNDAMVVFDEKGTFITSWGPDYKGGAHGLHLVKDGREEYLYLCDPLRHFAAKTTLDGKELFRFPFPEGDEMYQKTEEYRPTNVAVAPDGTVFVADGYGKSYIHRYTSNGQYLGSFAGPGSEAGQTQCPHGLMVDLRRGSPELVVADRSNRRLQYFSLDGKHLRFVTQELRAPCHFDQRGKVMVIPDLESRVTLLDENNHLIVHLGDGGHYKDVRTQSRAAFTPGKFVAPHSAIFDHEGNILVVEWVEVGRVTKLKKLT